MKTSKKAKTSRKVKTSKYEGKKQCRVWMDKGFKSILRIMSERNLRPADVVRDLCYSSSLVSKYIRGLLNVSIPFLLEFAEYYCKGDLVYFFTGVSGNVITEIEALLKDLNQDEQNLIVECLRCIIKLLKLRK